MITQDSVSHQCRFEDVTGWSSMVHVFPVFSLKRYKFADAHLRALGTGKYSDFELYCQGHVFKVHRVVLSWIVTYFKRMLAGNMKVRVPLRIIVALSLL
jgi:hypothetical protein